MKKINFNEHVLPHLIAVAIFLLTTIFFFKPVFFDHKTLVQGDIKQWEGSSKALRDFREQTGEEGLWAETMFSGMPAYLINVEWGNKAVGLVKRVISFSLPHPVENIYLAFLSYYILLLAFGVRPPLAIAGALAFGLSSYMIIGMMAGHNGRIGAISFMPLVMAGVHLVFTRRVILGFGVTTAALALHFRENHLQISYYLFIIIAVYGVIKMIELVRQQKIAEFAKAVGVIILAAAIGVATYIGPLWAITEYSAYTIRGKSELGSNKLSSSENNGLTKDYAFTYSSGKLETMTLLIPDFYGGSSFILTVQDPQSDTYKALMRNANEQTANQLANYARGYWGPQGYSSPYYGGAVMILLFAIGVAFADKKYVWWLVPVTVLAIMMTWGRFFPSFNYFLFDYLPGYNKFRSQTFTLIIALFAIPLLGMLGLERVLQDGLTQATRKKFLIAWSIPVGICVLVLLLSGMMSFLKEGEEQLPAWFTAALASDRKGLLMGDAFRSLVLILLAGAAIYFNAKKISVLGFYAFIVIMVMIDMIGVDKRYLKDENYVRERENQGFPMTGADQEILKDKSYYRVYNLNDPLNEARTSYFHNSLGGYHGAKLRRYQDLFDSCLSVQTNRFISDAQSGQLDFQQYGGLNMLNTKYIVFGEQRDNIIRNPSANGPAWFVKEVVKVNTPAEELKRLCSIDTRSTAVVDVSKFSIPAFSFDSASTITIKTHVPNKLVYETNATTDAFAVFSEIYYEKGWRAFIDGKETPIMRADYVLRALPVPSGKHEIEFRFEPKAYTTGNAVTSAASWLMLLVLLGSLGWTLKKERA
jgi:hypothetical protein